MRILPVSRVSPGMRLAESVYSSKSGVRHALLQRGVVLNEAMLRALLRAGVFAVYIEDRLSEGINPVRPISDETRHETAVAIERVFEQAKDGRTTRIPTDQVQQLESLVDKIMSELRSSGDLVSFLGDLGSFDAYTLNHSVNVCVLGLMIGEAYMTRFGWRDYRGERRTDDIESRLQKLGLGLLLHDIGKVVIPRDVLCKPGALTDDEMAMIRQHPAAGATLVDGMSVSPLTRAVILGHHERWDGKGYPHGKAREDIHINARIGAIADVYDAVSSDRVYRTRRPSHEAYELVLGSSGSAFDPELVKIFSRVVAPYPVGTAVMLSTGERGLIAENHAEHCTRPTIRITHGPQGQLLSAAKEIHLIEHLSVTVLNSMEDPGDAADAPAPEPLADEADRREAMADHRVGEALPV